MTFQQVNAYIPDFDPESEAERQVLQFLGDFPGGNEMSDGFIARARTEMNNWDILKQMTLRFSG